MCPPEDLVDLGFGIVTSRFEAPQQFQEDLDTGLLLRGDLVEDLAVEEAPDDAFVGGAGAFEALSFELGAGCSVGQAQLATGARTQLRCIRPQL